MNLALAFPGGWRAFIDEQYNQKQTDEMAPKCTQTERMQMAGVVLGRKHGKTINRMENRAGGVAGGECKGAMMT